MALHAEPPSSKLKREQALRNILAARRRQLLGPRASEVTKSFSPWSRSPGSSFAASKDVSDMLEAQESRHGVYVTAPIGDQSTIIVENDDEDSTKLNNDDFVEALSSTSSIFETIAKSEEQNDRPSKNSLLIRINDTNEKIPKNISQSSLSRVQKNVEPENRRKNIVAMPESLYNHFRPVESNIPVEDMTQFLYFGQKIPHDIQQNNATATNNSIFDSTSTLASVPISRRRYSLKRFSTTTSIPLPRLEEIINEEMNIALERSTIEKNKIPKTKIFFRSPGSGTYFRKSSMKPGDHVIVSNVIPARESAINASAGSDAVGSNQSAHADQVNHVAIVGERRGSTVRIVPVTDHSLAHRARNSPIGNAAPFHGEIEITGTTDINVATARTSPIDDTDRRSNSTKDKTTNNQSTTIKTFDDSLADSSTDAETSTTLKSSTTYDESNDDRSNKITTLQFVDSNLSQSTTSSTKTTITPEIATRTINDIAYTTGSIVSSTNPTSDATTASSPHSSLRIVVTEPMGYESDIETGATASWDDAEGPAEDGKKGVDNAAKAIARSNVNLRTGKPNPVTRSDSTKDPNNRQPGDFVPLNDGHRISGLSSNRPTNRSPHSAPNNTTGSTDASDSPASLSESSTTTEASESTLPASVSSKTEQPLPSAVSTAPRIEHKHAYAYEITNVTRLLRNYTGPGLNVVADRKEKGNDAKKENDHAFEMEESGTRALKKKPAKVEDVRDGTTVKEKRGNDEEREPALTRTNAGSSVHEIRNDGGSDQPTPRQSTLPLLLLPTLQRPSSSSGSGGIVEPTARKLGVLSAGTDVDGATASNTSSSNTITSTGSTPIIRSAGGGGNSGARGSRGGDSSGSSSSSNSQSLSGSSSSSSSSSSSASSPSSSASSSPAVLVGERGRKGALGARQQYHQQNQNRGIVAGGRASGLSAGVGTGARNTWTSVSTPFATTEVSGASTAGVVDYVGTTSLIDPDRKIIDEVTENIFVTPTVRWNHTGIKKLGGGAYRTDGYGYDRRYLRKSVSGVINQRTNEEGLLKELKRRRESAVQFGGSGDTSFAFSSSFNNRRIKASRGGTNEESRSSISRPMETNTAGSDSADGQSTTSQSTRAPEDALGEDSDGIIEVGDKMTKVTVVPSTNDNLTMTPMAVTMENLPESVNTVANSSISSPKKANEETKNETATEESFGAEVVGHDRVKSDERANLTEQTTMGGLGAISESVIDRETTKEESNDSSTTSMITTDTSSPFDGTEPVDFTTTEAPPVFPVTPKMLLDPNEARKPIENDDVSPDFDDLGKPVDGSEANRPFGLAKDLDPSEIQKMYRSQTTVKPEAAMTTIVPGFADGSMDTETQNPVIPFGEKDQAETASPVNSSVTRKPVGGERSPEVRGRNLSDEIKDKDDVLPIMQLYNTSDMFNGTARDSQEAGKAVGAVLLPGVIEVNATTRHNDTEPGGAAGTVPEASESPAKERKGEQSRPVQKHQQDNSDAETNGISKKNRTNASREETNDSTGSTRWSNHTNSNNSHTTGGGQANRTRLGPTHHRPSPTEFMGYRPELNGSFFGPGMISVGSRETVNISEVITKRHDGDAIATQETVAIVSYILATLIVFPIAVGVGLILRRLIIRNRKVLEESDTSSEISCRKDALNLEKGDFKTSIEKAITKLPRIQHLCHEAEKPPPPPSQESRWEFPRDKLRLQTVLGQGNFGQVWKAEADDLTGHQGTTRLVAVKTVKEGASAREKEDLIRELEIMQQLGNHSNVVTLLGCCTEEEPHYLILEYVMYGKLLAYLRDHRTRQDFYNFSEDSAALTSRDLTVFGYCVARGMEYLASKKIIHRDLAARNVLVDHNKLCKIADFGMSRFANDEGEIIEARHGRNALPIRWMAPESLIYSLFTTKTDVWSFGILMWEIVTLGSTPYPDMAAREVMRNVQNGYRLERPSHCRSELFRVIARCWHADPDRRPEFQILRRDMAQLLEDSMNGHYVDLESFASECTD